jgi:hypothetical protein
MSTGKHVHLQLDLDPAADPIDGALQDADGHAVEFSGWLGFAAAIQSALAAATDPPPEEPSMFSRPG